MVTEVAVLQKSINKTNTEKENTSTNKMRKIRFIFKGKRIINI